MSQIALLNNIDHQDLRIRTEWSPTLGDNYAVVPTFPAEFRRIQAYYPILFSFSSTNNQFTPIALLGLENDENLFIRAGQWHAGYIPACAEVRPFFIGEGGQNQGLSIHVDLDSPKLSRQQHEGIPLFMPHGGNSDFINHIASLLGAINEHLPSVTGFVGALVQYDLIEPFTLEARLANGANFKLDGFYTINEDKLAALPQEDLAQLHTAGFLSDIYMVLASMSQLNRLIYTKNQRLQDKDAA